MRRNYLLVLGQFCLLLLALVWPALQAQAAATTLVAGDIAIIGFNFDDPDELAFVLLRNVGSGTQITFTDNGWRSTNTFRTGEGSFTWTAATDLPAGTVVKPAASGVAFSTSGDQILAYQGSSSSPTFLYALNSEGTAWQTDATDSNTSKLPTGLTNGNTAIAMTEIDNGKYVGVTSGSKAVLLAAISNKANWSVNDTTRQTMPTGPFTVGTPTATFTPTPTRTPSPTPTRTPSPTPTFTPTPSGVACPAATITTVGAIQGTGASSPLVNSNVTIRGRVVADFQGANGLNGFFVQDAGDGNSNSSDGIFVYSNTTVNLGDPVQVSGTVKEFNGLTELTPVSAVTICGNPAAVSPTNVTLPMASATDWEKYEGMLIRLNQTLYVTDNYTLGRYGEVGLATERLWQPTNVTTPGAAANALAAQNALKRITLDDGSAVQNGDPIVFPSPGLTASNTLRAGDSVTGVTGVLDYSGNKYRLHATSVPTFVASNPRSAAPAAVGGSVRVGSINVLNYFNGPTFPTSRGASSSTEFTRQRAKVISAILGMNADIIGLMEIENDGYGSASAIQDLVNGLNAAAPVGTTYAFINPGTAQLGSDEIAVGLIYRTQTVQPLGAPATIGTGSFSSLNRQPLAQTFRHLASNGELTVVVNHFKSKGSACTGDPDLGDGQGNCNLTRVAAASQLLSWLATDPTSSGDSDFLIIGDLNSYAQEDPITTLENGGYVNLIEQFNGSTAYSYVFDGQSGYLDHALASSSLASQVTGATEWHINADEPISLDYNVEFKTAGQVTSLYSSNAYRASDHDPVVVGLTLQP